MNELRMIYVPVALLQIAEELQGGRLKPNQKEMFLTRLEAARDFADETLARYRGAEATNTVHMKDFFKKRPS